MFKNFFSIPNTMPHHKKKINQSKEKNNKQNHNVFKANAIMVNYFNG